MAVSIAESSRMNKEPDNELSLLQQEERRYVFWSLYVIDKVSALVLGNAPLLVDLNCTLRLPEEERSFRETQQNNMTSLATAKDSYSTRGGFAKLIVACSLVGQLATLSQDDTLCWGRFGGSLLELHKSLSARIRRLGSMLSEEEGSFTTPTGVDGRVQIMYARSMFHCIGIFINHPFFVKRYIPANQRSPQVCTRTNQQCREHAERLGDWLRSANSYDAVPHNQLFPGYAIFNAGLVQCLFMCSPDRAIASKSRQLYGRLKTLLFQQAVSGVSSDPDYYIRTLEYFANRPGAAHLLADASSTYMPRSGQPGLWHFLDFAWLDDLLSPNEASNGHASEETIREPVASYETSSAAFPCFNTASSDTPQPSIEDLNRRTPQRQSSETSVQDWNNNISAMHDTSPLPFGFMPHNEDISNGTGMPTPSQSPPFGLSDEQQSYEMMDVEPESFAKWVASAYSRWDASFPDPGNLNKNQDIRLLYG